jgi:hypothetical protein
MLQEDQTIVANYCDTVAASLLGVQGDPYSTILWLRDEVVILQILEDLDRALRSPFGHAKPDTNFCLHGMVTL